ncbi:MAG: glycosyltransferase [Ruminococcaceae bacterium]|nr:glycosyltransferase [Oscillospiraceae bacterium]
MNVLMVTGAMDSGGAETHVSELASALVREGHSVTVVSAGGRMVLSLARAGVAHVKLPLTKKTPLALFKSFKELMRLTSERKFHVLHAHTRISAFVGYCVCAQRGMGMVSTVHAHYKNSLPLRKLSRWGDRVIAVSEDLREYMQKNANDVLSENVCVIPNGIDTARFCPSAKGGGHRIVFISRLDHDCSQAAYALCLGAEKIREKFPDVEIVIGGGGSELESIRRLAEKINSRLCHKVISLAGRVEDTATLLRSADLFVGVSRAALEAMSAGVPVVLAGNEGFGGILDGEALEFFARSNFCARGSAKTDVSVLTEAVLTALSMPKSEREALGERLRNYVCEYHSVEYMAERTLAVYRSLIEARSVKVQRGGVLLCGYYGFGNMGDDVLLARAVARARKKYPALPISALTASPYVCRRKFGVRCVPRGSLICILRETKRAEVVVFGGGTLLQNGTSRRSLWYYLFILRLAEKRGKRVELWGNGVEKIKGKFSRRVTAIALSRCAFLGLRDRESVKEVYALLNEFGKDAPSIRLESDLAASAFPENSQNAKYTLARLGISGSERFAAVALRGGENKESLQQLRVFLNALCADGIKLIFVVMYPAEDLKVTLKMCESLDGILAYPLGAADVQAIMRRCTLVCGMRYHALVFAHSVGTPFIGFGGGEKIRRFCQEHSFYFS